MGESLNKAVELAQRGRYEEALAAFNTLIDTGPEDLEPRGHRAWLLIGMGRYEDAGEDYRFILERDPENRDARLHYAGTLRKIDRREEAITILGKLLQQDPLNLQALEVWKGCVEDGKPPSSEAPGLNLEVSQGEAPTLNPIIESLERDPANFPASVFPQVGRFLYALVRCLQPKMVIETGCFVGYSTLCIAQALEENGAGRVHSFDLFLPLGEGYTSPVLGPCSDPLRVARSHLESAGLAHRVTFHKGDSSLGIREDFKDNRPDVDFAFIDGDHRIKGCFKDWEAVLDLMADGAVAALHDTAPENCAWVGPNVLIGRCRERPGEFQSLNFPTPEGFGMGLVQKIGPVEDGGWNPSMTNLVKEFLQTAIWKRKA